MNKLYLFFVLEKMTGHCQTVNDVKFSPDGRVLASASFDKSIKLWDGNTGNFITTLRGHVQCVFQIAWYMEYFFPFVISYFSFNLSVISFSVF